MAANVLDKYGIKEVADVFFYDIKDDGTMGDPVLYLDTLKVSTIEQTAEQTEAKGGKGNPPLIIWDYGKEINVTLEDALFSMKSMSIMFGDGKLGSAGNPGEQTAQTIIKTYPVSKIVGIDGDNPYIQDNGIKIDLTDKKTQLDAYKTKDFITLDLKEATKSEIEISANSFPGTYYVTGDTYARSQTTGKDEFFQFIISKAKVNSENTITMEAEGDPSVFNMSLRVLRGNDGEMMKLVKYGFTNDTVKADIHTAG